jgi:hypothetical protein
MGEKIEVNIGPASFGLGSLLAGALSFLKGNTLGWIVVHAILGWLYVIYLCFGCGGGLPLDVLNIVPADQVQHLLPAEQGDE